MMKLDIFTDGGARGNPGPAAIGVFIKKDKTVIVKFGKRIGRATNNEAEYQALIFALKYIQENFLSEDLFLNFYLDSQLVVNQLNGKYKIKEKRLAELANFIRSLENKFSKKIFYKYIPREKNKEADFLVNKALDEDFVTS